MRLTNLFIVFCLLFAIASCSDEVQSEEDSLEPSVKDEIVLESTDYESLLFDCSEGEQVIRFKTSGLWKAEISSDVSEWLTVSPTAGNKGSVLMTFHVQANEGYEGRVAEITLISGQKRQLITVHQMQKDALVVAKPSYTVDSEGGTLSVEVGHNVEFDVDVDNYWITPVASRVYEKTNVHFSIMKNPNYSNREGTIKITSKDGKLEQEIKVYQSALLGLAVSEKNKTFDSNAHVFDVEIKSNVAYKVIDPEVSWLHRVESRALTSRTLRYQVDASDEVESRTALILLESTDSELKDTVTVLQLYKNALVVAQSSYDFTPKGGEISIPVSHNVDFTYKVEGGWIEPVQAGSRAYVTDSVKFRIAQNVKLEAREGSITFTSSVDSIVQEIKVLQGYDEERKALHELYLSTQGDGWLNHANWCSESPLNEWYGVQTDGEGYVTAIRLNENNLQGSFPESFRVLTSLEEADFSGNGGLSGVIPDVLFQMSCWNTAWPEVIEGTRLYTEKTLLAAPEFSVRTVADKQLTDAVYAKNKLTALFQFKIGSSESAKFMPVMLDFYDKCHAQGFDVVGISLDNRETTLDHINKSKMLWNVFCYYDNETGYKLSTVDDRAPLLHLVNAEGKVVFSSVMDNLSDLEACLKTYFDLSVKIKPLDEQLFARLVYNHNKYPTRWIFEGDKPAAILFYEEGNALCQTMNTNLLQLAQEFEGRVDFYKVDAKKERGLFDLMVKDGEVPSLFVMSNHNDPKLVERDADIETIRQAITKSLLRSVYVSTDYSSDGKVVQLQRATEGNGIDIVLMGDGYSDRQIHSGDYEKDMRFVCDKLFTIEPYASFKNLFNVYYVAAVSKNEGYYVGGKTTFDCWFSFGTQVGGNDAKCMNYSLKAISRKRMDEASIVVVMNSSNYAGTCWMFSAGYETDYGSGTTISYFPKGKDEEVFEQLLHHELGGHGFAKLADEYVNSSVAVTPDVVESYRKNEPRGWWKNIDFTDDPAQVKWSRFLSDARYEQEKLGVFKGGATYGDGVWHPSENNIMIDNKGGFNAPSREAIYYRLHKLAYGPDWKYDFEEFVAYDRRNLDQFKSRARGAYPYKPTHRPVVVNKTWREVLEASQE